MKKTLRIVVDCDDVLFRCNSYAVERLNRDTGSGFRKEDIREWGIMHSGLDARLAYFHDPEFVRTQPVMEGARDFLAALVRKAEVFVATSVPAACAGERFSAILREFPMISPENILIGSRKDILNADMLLDDSPQHIKGSNADYAVLFRQPWNLDLSGVVAVSNYREFLTLVDMVDGSSSGEPRKHGFTPAVLVGPSGSGKNRLADNMEAGGLYRRIQSYTTCKDPRHPYHSLSREQFYRKAANGGFLETTSYAGNMYGVSRDDIEAAYKEGRIPLLVLDINGAVSLKREYGACIYFVAASKETCIRNILMSDALLDEKVRRISAIDGEMKNKQLCDDVIVI